MREDYFRRGDAVVVEVVDRLLESVDRLSISFVGIARNFVTFSSCVRQFNELGGVGVAFAFTMLLNS